jgi:hypothetical protein
MAMFRPARIRTAHAAPATARSAPERSLAEYRAMTVAAAGGR